MPMMRALDITLAATAFILATVIVMVLAGWFPRLAALAARGLKAVFPSGQPRLLDLRERAEMTARLWIL